MNPHTQGIGFEFSDLFEGQWAVKGTLADDQRKPIMLAISFVNSLAIILRDQGISLVAPPIPPFPDFSYIVAQTDDAVLLILGQSPMRSVRYAVFEEARGQDVGTTDAAVAAWCARRGFAWGNLLTLRFPADILTPTPAESWEVAWAMAERTAAELATRQKEMGSVDNLDPTLCFVIMSFADNPQLKDFYEMSVKPTVERLGYRCERVDEQHFNDSIRARILDNIRRARFIVADLTGARPNCYYELGIAHALSKEVVHLARGTQDIHFDAGDFNFIIYGRIDELRRRLHERVEATIGHGPLAQRRDGDGQPST